MLFSRVKMPKKTSTPKSQSKAIKRRIQRKQKVKQKRKYLTRRITQLNDLKRSLEKDFRRTGNRAWFSSTPRKSVRSDAKTIQADIKDAVYSIEKAKKKLLKQKNQL